MFFKKGLAVKKVKKYIKTLNGKGTCSRRSTMAWNQTGRWLRNNIYQRSRHIIIFNHIVILSQNKITLIYLILPSLQSWSITTNTFTTNGITNFSQSIQPNWLFQSVAPSRVIYIRLKGVTHHPVLYFTIQITKKYCTAMSISISSLAWPFCTAICYNHDWPAPGQLAINTLPAGRSKLL